MAEEGDTMIKVAKFGGSSCATAAQFQKVKDIVLADPARRYVVVSAPGKRMSGDTKVTDLLYKAYHLAEEDADFEPVMAEIRARFQEIVDDLSLSFDLDENFRIITDNFKRKWASIMRHLVENS